ncbi:hypothetical protein CH337_12090 [Rhodoblastus acidophilus]|nr:hypothetical protein CH337_12090 [Rhodoblastus acidophilus]
MEIEMSPAASDPTLHERVAVLEQIAEDMAPKVDAMYEMMLQGRGATRLGRAVVGIAGTAGIFTVVGHKWHAFLAWLGS